MSRCTVWMYAKLPVFHGSFWLSIPLHQRQPVQLHFNQIISIETVLIKKKEDI